MVDWGRAVKMPFQDYKKLGILGLMYVIPVVNIVTSFFATGYGFKMAESSMKKKFSLPEWEDWGGLFLKGLLGAIISIIFMLPAMIVAFVGIGSSLFSMMAVGNFDPTIMFQSVGIGIVAALLGLVAIYLLPAALMFFLKEDSFASAFNFSGIFKKVFTGDYFVAWIGLVVYAIVVGIVAGIISGLLAVTVVLPLVIMALVQAIVLITGMTVFGEVFQK
ncbi:DUF4013 domain-containing protein [Candidatus Woesearchaeota archaeon]|nr:DUF4013 domain-containing protein [Candidatus Woesearchaeota archaeon]